MLAQSFLLDKRYQIQEKLTEKAERTTFVAKDLKSEKSVIIKILEFNSLFKWDDLKLFEREAETLKNLDHPLIPKYLDYFEVNNEYICGFALVQTYIEAVTLEDQIKQGRKFTEPELIELAKKILGILNYLHECLPSVIHRDIKPSNILLLNRSGNNLGDVYLVDFGSVQTAATKESGTITIVGSYGYIALEQFGGQATTSSDLYSLGMTLIYLITGIHPAELPKANGVIELNYSGITKSFKQWLVKMTEHEFNNRFSSSKFALEALDFEEQEIASCLQLKPRSSLITLDINADLMTIKYPKKNNQDVKLFFDVCLLLILVTLLGIFLLYPFSSVRLLLIIVTPLLMTKNNSYSFNKQKILFIKRNTSNLKEGIVGIAWDHLNGEICRENIILISMNDFIAYNPGYIFNEYIDAKGVLQKTNETITIAPSLSIHSAGREIQVGEQNFSKLELLWLGTEICNFLDLDLQTVYPTPKIPPTPECGCGC